MSEFEVRLEILNENGETVFEDSRLIDIDRDNINDICDAISGLDFDEIEASDCIMGEGWNDPDHKKETV
ncbi:MAG: hypothetical protein WCS15_06920 [Prevotella sp.]